MAAVVALKAKEAGTPKLRFQALLWPVTDANFSNGSYHQFAEGHFLTRNMMQWFWDSYTTAPRQRDDIHASPLRASLKQLKGRRSLRPQAWRCRCTRDGRALQRHDPRLRPAQRTRPGARYPQCDGPGCPGDQTASAVIVVHDRCGLPALVVVPGYREQSAPTGGHGRWRFLLLIAGASRAERSAIRAGRQAVGPIGPQAGAERPALRPATVKPSFL